MDESCEWHHKTDPHNVVPIGFRCPRNQYTVVGFASPCGKQVRKMVTFIRYDGDKNQYSTTYGYLSTVRDYILATSHEDFVNKFICGRE